MTKIVSHQGIVASKLKVSLDKTYFVSRAVLVSLQTIKDTGEIKSSYHVI